MAREFKRTAPLVLLILAILGWSAAALAFWHRSDGQELPQPAPVVRSEDQDKSLTEISTKAQSALSMIIRLRDEAAQAFQEVRDRSAAVRKNLAGARDQLDDIQQKITSGNAELSIINKRLETARLRETQEKRKGDASPRVEGNATPELATAVPTTPQQPSTPFPTAKIENRISVSIDPRTATALPRSAH
jgi:hypothetical protein